ncbi:MAG: circadian clock protein KaiB [Bacteroidetes bacterium]|nr:circadian clock protein KaiB [Bacteroidota bacterium]
MLFISGMSVKSINAIENLRDICEGYLPGKFELDIIDISQNPELASANHIIATPTLIKKEPAPQKIILGDLSNIKKVLNALDISPK